MSKMSPINFSELWKGIDFTKPWTLSLIFSNVLVIFFAAVDNLSAIDVLWIYWMQSVIIGIFNFIRIINLSEFSTEGFRQGGKNVRPTRGTKFSTAIFFLIHYGFFHLIYAFFLGSFSSFGYFSGGEFETIYFLLSSGMFFTSYLVEFIKSRKEDSQEMPNIGKIMFAPYARIIPMHLTIILGGFISVAGGFFFVDTSLTIIILFTSIKTVVDLTTHSVDFAKLKSTTVTSSN